MNPSARPHDRRNPLVIDTHDLGRQAGAMRELRTDVPAPEGIGDDIIGVPPASPIALDLKLESVVEGVLVTGTAQVTVAGECGRCLEPISNAVEIDIQELYLYPGTDPDDVEASRMEGETIDLEPLVRDEVVLDLPFMPLCREDCAGLCQTCGANLNAEPDHNHGERIDPRWGDLAAWQDAQDN
ncbi:MAG: DUF177 domain-containing protein [Propionibacteriaceae bacterium]|nr:DUF177 domain-containing protein [Propionibacteriaceae bacterium]